MQVERDRQGPLLRALITSLSTGTPTADGLPCLAASIYSEAGGSDQAGFAPGNVPIHQVVPVDLPAPFIAIRDVDPTPWGSKDRPGDDITVNFLVVSQYPGQLEAQNIAQALLVQLTRNALDLGPEGLRVVLLAPLKQLTSPLSDGRTFTRLIPIRVIVEDLASQDPRAGG